MSLRGLRQSSCARTHRASLFMHRAREGTSHMLWASKRCQANLFCVRPASILMEWIPLICCQKQTRSKWAEQKLRLASISRLLHCSVTFRMALLFNVVIEPSGTIVKRELTIRLWKIGAKMHWNVVSKYSILVSPYAMLSTQTLTWNTKFVSIDRGRFKEEQSLFPFSSLPYTIYYT